ncbi:MAG: SCO6745 family protein [Ilumatobacteraceae bacterium]
MDQQVVREAHTEISLAHRFVYFVPEAPEEYAALGITGAGGYFASRAAPMGAVPDDVVIATFYNFSPLAVTEAMVGVWEAASPESWEAARLRAVGRAMQRVGAELSSADIGEARSLIDSVVGNLDLAGKPLAAANSSVALPEDPMVALWQQLAVVREWRGDVHVALLVVNEIGPCECLVLSTGTGRFPLRIAQVTRRWDQAQWAAAVARLAERGWVTDDGTVTPAGVAERNRIEDETDRLCASIWQPVGDSGAARLSELIKPIHSAMDAAGTYARVS